MLFAMFRSWWCVLLSTRCISTSSGYIYPHTPAELYTYIHINVYVCMFYIMYMYVFIIYIYIYMHI